MIAKPKQIWSILYQTYEEWSEDRVSRLGAALAYYSIFSIAPLLVIAVRVAGAIYGQDAVRGQLKTELQALLTPQAAAQVEQMVARMHTGGEGTFATIASIVALLLGATGAVVALKDALNTVWGVMADPNRAWWWTIWDRLMSLVIVLGVGALLLLSAILSAVLTAVGTYAQDWITFPLPVAQAINWIVSLVVVTLLFAMIFKWLPDTKVAWRDVWIGAVLTAVLFLIGKELLGWYLARGTVGSAYGTAGSLVVFLVWAYYSAQILLLGAEFTQVYARRIGERIEPKPWAVRMTEARREQQNMLQKERRQKEAEREQRHEREGRATSDEAKARSHR